MGVGLKRKKANPPDRKSVFWAELSSTLKQAKLVHAAADLPHPMNDLIQNRSIVITSVGFFSVLSTVSKTCGFARQPVVGFSANSKHDSF